MAGRYFEDWQVGDHIAHEIRRTVTETDNLLFSVMTHNPQPLHIDAEAAKASEFGRIIVNGTFTFALMIGLSVGETTLGTLIANLGYDRLAMPSPVFSRRHAACRDGGGSAARIPLTSECRHRHLPSPGVQPAWRAGLRTLAHRARSRALRRIVLTLLEKDETATGRRAETADIAQLFGDPVRGGGRLDFDPGGCGFVPPAVATGPEQQASRDRAAIARRKGRKRLTPHIRRLMPPAVAAWRRGHRASNRSTK